MRGLSKRATSTPPRRNAAGSPLISLRRTGSLPPLFYMTAGFGDVLALAHLSRLLDPERPSYALQPTLEEGHAGHGGDGRGGAWPTLDSLLASYLRQLRAVAPAGPYLLAGNSAGGLVAFELAQRLQAAGQRVAFLGILDSPIVITPFVYATHQAMQFVAGRFLRDGRWLAADLYRSLRSLFADDGLHVQVRALRHYRPAVYPGHITLFTAARSHLGRTYASPHEWRAVAGGGLTEVRLPGHHVSFLREPHVGELAERLNALLAAACAPC